MMKGGEWNEGMNRLVGLTAFEVVDKKVRRMDGKLAGS